MRPRARQAAFVAIQIVLWITPMMFPTIPFGVGLAAYGVAVGLLLYAAADLARSKGWLPALPSLPIHIFRQEWPNFEKWDQQETFQLYEAACLWFNQEPRLPMPRRAKEKYQNWRNMIYEGGLPAESEEFNAAMNLAFEKTYGDEDRVTVTPHTRVHREILQLLADEDKEHPLFLFPHKRGE